MAVLQIIYETGKLQYSRFVLQGCTPKENGARMSPVLFNMFPLKTSCTLYLYEH